jgi:hypothetical protein
MKCSNGKYKYGANGNCQFDTLDACKAAAAAIHIQEGKDMYPVQPTQPMNPHHDAMCQCAGCKGMYPKYK